MERNPSLTPPCSQPPTATQAPPVAGHPVAKHQQHPFVNNKSPALWNLSAAQIEGADKLLLGIFGNIPEFEPVADDLTADVRALLLAALDKLGGIGTEHQVGLCDIVCARFEGINQVSAVRFSVQQDGLGRAVSIHADAQHIADSANREPRPCLKNKEG